MWINTDSKHCFYMYLYERTVRLYVYVHFVSSLIKLLIVSAPFGGRDLS